MSIRKSKKNNFYSYLKQIFEDKRMKYIGNQGHVATEDLLFNAYGKV